MFTKIYFMKSVFAGTILGLVLACSSPQEISLTSTITCPECGFPKLETLPTEVCLIRYDCTNCGVALFPEGDDCCVYCTYGDFECPSIQEGKACCETP